VRHLTGEPAALAAQATALLEGNDRVFAPVVAVHETAFVLMRHYGVPRDAVVDLLVDLLERENVDTLDADREQVIAGLQMCQGSGRVSFGDALIWAAARSRPVGALATFDRRFPSNGLELHVLA
jgi:predicted nucleic acid-binding protein